MEEQKNKKFCKDCRYYKAVYTKCPNRFYKEKLGFCVNHQKVVNKYENCELQKYRPYKEKTVTIEHLDKVINEVKELERILYNCDY